MIKQKSLPRNIRERLPGVSERLSALSQVNALWLFGSYARGEETPLSDLDFAYLPIPGQVDANSIDVSLYAGLSSFLATDELTVVNLAEAAPALAFRVLQEGKLLFCRNPEAVADLVERTLSGHPEARRIVREMLEGETGAAMEIDREKVLSLFRLLEADLRRLREKAGLNEEDYLADPDAQDVVIRRFQTAIETCVNIGAHLIARLRLRLAEDYASVVAILSEEAVLSRDLAGRMAGRIRTLEEFAGEIRTFLVRG